MNAAELRVPLGPGLPEIVLFRPTDQDALLEEALRGEGRALPDEGTPYFAELWPAALPLARFLISERLEGRILELGCGLGLVGLALAKVLAAKVTLTDGSPAALEVTRRAVARNAPYAHAPEVALLDWRSPKVAERFPVVIGADVLYAKEAFPWLARAASACVTPGGRVFLAEPQRPVARSAASFLELEDLRLARRVEAENQVVVQEWRPGARAPS